MAATVPSGCTLTRSMRRLGRSTSARRTSTTNNAASVKPFGTIDTPAQGGTASGSAYTVFGWALSPRGTIPTNGSTITVYVDGVARGNPTYNNNRSDIATLFPGYANSNGAIGYYMLNTTHAGERHAHDLLDRHRQPGQHRRHRQPLLHRAERFERPDGRSRGRRHRGCRVKLRDGRDGRSGRRGRGA